MKIEKLSETSIRCTLTRVDLESRDLKISELAYGSEKAKALFKDMIAQASFECGFDADNAPLMIEAIPLSPDCIVLVITKVSDPEELDTRFSKFAPSNDDDDYDDFDEENESRSDNSIMDKLDEILNAKPDLSEFLPFAKKNSKQPEEWLDVIEEMTSNTPASEPGNEESEAAAPAIPLKVVISFDNMDYAEKACECISGFYTGDSVLYKNETNHRFYLLLESGTMAKQDFVMACNFLTEYGNTEPSSYATISHMAEHFKTIIKKNAVAILAQI